MNLATSGISGLDAQMGGGIPRGLTLLVLAEPGNAVPLFVEQFAGGGLDAGEDVHFFEFDRPVVGVPQRVGSFILRGNEKKAAFYLYDGYSAGFAARGGRMREPNAIPVPPMQALASLLGAVQQQTAARPYRLVLESLSSLSRDGNERELLEFFRTLVFMGHDTGGLHAVSLVRGLHSPEFEARMRHLAGGVLEFGVERKGFGAYNYLYVSKLLNVQDPVKLLQWKETDKGLWLESTKRVL